MKRKKVNNDYKYNCKNTNSKTQSRTMIRTSTPIEAMSGGSHSSSYAAVASFKDKFLKEKIETFIVRMVIRQESRSLPYSI